jgi:antitoxin VapB
MVEPLNDVWAWLDAIVGPLDDDFVEAVNEQSGQQERPALDELFQGERLGEGRDRH